MWFMVFRWPQSHEGDWARPCLCKLARHGPRPVRNEREKVGDEKLIIISVAARAQMTI